VILWSIIAAFWATSPLRADRIDAGGTVLQGIHIVDLDAARIAYRTPAGELRFVPIAQADLIQFNDLPELAEFNEAERLRNRSMFDKALPRYERAARVVDARWMPLVRARLIQTCDRLGEVDKLVGHFVALLDDEAAGAPLAAELLPRFDAGSPQSGPEAMVSPRGTERAAQSIADRMEHVASQSARVILEMLRFVIVARAGDREAGPLAVELIRQPIPLMVSTRPVYRVRSAAIQRWAADGHAEAALGELDGDIPTAPETVLPELLVAKARIALHAAGDRDALIRAAWSAMRVVIHFPEDELVPVALLLTADVHQRLGRVPTAVQLLDECRQHPRIDPATRGRAEAARSRLSATP